MLEPRPGCNYRIEIEDIVEVTDEVALMESAELFIDIVWADIPTQEREIAKTELREGGVEYAFQVLAQVCAMRGVRTVDSNSSSVRLEDYPD